MRNDRDRRLQLWAELSPRMAANSLVCHRRDEQGIMLPTQCLWQKSAIADTRDDKLASNPNNRKYITYY